MTKVEKSAILDELELQVSAFQSYYESYKRKDLAKELTTRESVILSLLGILRKIKIITIEEENGFLDRIVDENLLD